MKRQTALVLFFVGCCLVLAGQPQRKPWLMPSDTFSKSKFWTFNGAVGVGFGGFLALAGTSWYDRSDRTDFFFRDDGRILEYMDKSGHLFGGYYQAYWVHRGYSWAGMRHDKAVWGGFVVGSVNQLIMEILDGIHGKWGFSITDILANETGCALYLAQELAWQEQRVTVKLSSFPQPDPNVPIQSLDGLHTTNLRERANELHGTGFFSRLAKDHNARTYWASVNIASFLRQKPGWLPSWLNVAVGYGVENLYGDYRNTWKKDGSTYVLDPGRYPRYHQYYLSFDVDFSRLPVKSRLAKIALNMLNFIKIPSPTLEFNTKGGVRFHPVYF